LLPSVCQLVLLAVLTAMFLTSRLTVAAAAGATVFAQALSAGILLVYEQRHTGWFGAPLLALPALGDLVTYSALTHLSTVLYFLAQRVDVFLLSSMAGLGAVGLYSVAYGVAELLLLLPQRLGILFLPRVAGARDGRQSPGEVRLLSSVVFLGAVAAALLLALAAPFAIRLLYGEAFAGSVRPFLLLLPGVCAMAATSIQGNYLAGLGKVRTTATISFAGLVLNVALNLVWIPRYGVAGAALASSLTYWVQALLCARATAASVNATSLSLFTSASPAVLAGLLRNRLFYARPG